MKKKYSPTFSLQEEAFLRGKDLEHSFFIAKDYNKNGAKLFSSFKSIKDFLLWFDKQEDKCFYEKIINERVEYYDIDGKIKEHDYWKNDSKKILDDFFEARKNWIENTNYNNKNFNPEKDVFILEAEKINEKKSFHIIIRNGFIFKNNLQQKTYIKEFKKYLDDLGSGLTIDDAPYGANQCFRTIGSSKLGSIRPLIRSNYNKNSLTCDRRLFFASNIEPELKNASEISCITLNNKLGIEENKSYLNFVSGFEVKEKIKIDFDEKQVSPEEIKIMYDNLNSSRWDDRSTCLSLIWLGKNLGLSDKDLHYYCQTSDKYNEDWVQSIINTRREECNLTIGTLKYFLIQDVDKETLNKIFPKEKTFQEILKIPTKDRTGQEQDYYEKILKFINDSNIKELTHTEGFIERKNETFVLTRDINKGSISVVKAGLGKGKTTATVNHINNFDYDCIIILTPRRAYAQSTLSRVNAEINLPNDEKFVLYSDIKGSIKHKYIIIQVESLCRFIHDFEKENTLIILDEVESLLYQMTSHKTHGQNHVRNIEMFENMLTNSSKVLCMDAFISNRTLNILKNINKKFEYYNYTKNLEKRKAIEIPKKYILKNKLIEELEQGKKNYFFCSSRRQLTDYFLPDIRQKFPDKKIIEYHSKKMSVDLDKINDEWKTADLIVATCTITVGCNFDLQNVFNSIFVYASACSRNLVRDIFQSCYRVRHIIDKIMYFCLDTRHNGLNLPTSISEIKTTIENKVLFHKKHYEKFLKMEFTEETPKWVKDLLINNIFESNMSIMNLQSLFYKYLDLCNYELADEEEHDFDDLDFEDEINLIFEEYQYQDIPEITFTERQELLKKKKSEPLTELEEFKLNKSFFQATLITQGRSRISKEDQISLWNVYCNFGKKKFRNLAYEKGLKTGTMRICDIISASFPEVADNLSRKLEDIIEITDKLGLDNSQDFKEIDRGTVFEILPWLEEHSTRFHVNFGLRNRMTGKFTLKNGSELLNKIFSSWGYSKIKRGKRTLQRVDGKRVDVSNYNCQNTEEVDVYTHLEPKSKKKTDRKVRLLKEGEDPLEEKEE